MNTLFLGISHKIKCISFCKILGYEIIKCIDEQDMKIQLYYYVDIGYKVQ